MQKFEENQFKIDGDIADPQSEDTSILAQLNQMDDLTGPAAKGKTRADSASSGEFDLF